MHPGTAQYLAVQIVQQGVPEDVLLTDFMKTAWAVADSCYSAAASAKNETSYTDLQRSNLHATARMGYGNLQNIIVDHANKLPALYDALTDTSPETVKAVIELLLDKHTNGRYGILKNQYFELPSKFPKTR